MYMNLKLIIPTRSWIFYFYLPSSHLEASVMKNHVLGMRSQQQRDHIYINMHYLVPHPLNGIYSSAVVDKDNRNDM